MTATLRVQSNGQVTIPRQFWSKAGVATGSLLVVKALRGSIVLTHKSKPAHASEEYSPAQRRAISRQLAKGLKDVAQGRVHGPFASAEEFSASMEAEIKKIRTARKSQRRR